MFWLLFKIFLCSWTWVETQITKIALNIRQLVKTVKIQRLLWYWLDVPICFGELVVLYISNSIIYPGLQLIIQSYDRTLERQARVNDPEQKINLTTFYQDQQKVSLFARKQKTPLNINELKYSKEHGICFIWRLPPPRTIFGHKKLLFCEVFETKKQWIVVRESEITEISSRY